MFLYITQHTFSIKFEKINFLLWGRAEGVYLHYYYYKMLLHIQIPDSDKVPSTRSSRVYRARHWLGVAKLDFISNNQYNFYSPPPPVVSVPVTTESYKQTPGSLHDTTIHHPQQLIQVVHFVFLWCISATKFEYKLAL